MASQGYASERFVNLAFDTFECIICSLVVCDPYECHGCGKLFCKICITDWMNKNPAAKCPNRCTSTISPIFSKALQKMYNNLDIKCSNVKCGKVVKLLDLPKHESTCLKVKCWNFDICQKVQNDLIKCGKPVCSELCALLHELSKNFGNTKLMYEALGALGVASKALVPVSNGSSKSSSSIGGTSQVVWDGSKCGTGIQVTEGGNVCFLKEQSYLFRTIATSTGFMGGVNYWQIIADSRTENQLKIGVTLTRQFDYNSAFCDHPFGYAFYGTSSNNPGLGQLRHNSNASGPAYGKRFKKEGILGCCLNMNTGKLSFSLNGEYLGVAYNDPKLCSGPIYPAVSLLHCAGCKIRSGLPVPAIFKD